LINKSQLNQKNFNLYLNKNFNGKEKILISLSCGLDSTLLFYLIKKSNFFKNTNIFYVFFDHQKRAEGKFEIQNFISHYKIKKSKYFIKKIKIDSSNKGFQNNSRLARHKFINFLSKKIGTKDIFLGHHLDDLYETFFLRDIQQSNVFGLKSIFSDSILGLKFHRPLIEYPKKKILNFATIHKIFWSEDRTNSELDYTRNKIRNFLISNNSFSKIDFKKNNYSSLDNIFELQNKYFIKFAKNKYEVKCKEFNSLNDTLKLFVIQSFYYNVRHHFNRPIRKDSYSNLIKLLRNPKNITTERSIFGGKITSYKDKICLNLNLDFKRN
jgi:tRNA(Ile)-lysidine synthetase-like protein